MATFQLTVEQVSFLAEDLPVDSSSVDSLSSVVDPNVDFSTMAEKQSYQKSSSQSTDFSEEWRSAFENPAEPHSPVKQGAPASQTLSKIAMDSSFWSSKENNSGGVLSEGDHLYSYDSLGATYPTIPLPVAHYLNKHNPELCAEAEKYLKLKEMPEAISNISHSSYSVSEMNTPPSPLKSMTSTSEALALQHSVIGNPGIKPVSPEIVAQIVEKTRMKLEQQHSNNGQKNSLSEYNSVNGNNHIHSAPFSELIRYPSEFISATVERKSWFSSSPTANSSMVPKNSKSSTRNKANDTPSRRSSHSSNSSIGSKKSTNNCSSEAFSSFSPKLEIAENAKIDENTLVANSHNSLYEKSFTSSLEYETESSYSEKFEVESTYSEAFETESNISEISGVDEEMLHVKKMLIDVSSSNNSNLSSSSLSKKLPLIFDKDLKSSGTQVGAVTSNATTSPVRFNIHNIWPHGSTKIDQSTETEHFQLFELMREKANLEGQLESVTKEMSELAKDRARLQSLVASLQTQMKSNLNQTDAAVAEKQNILKELEAQHKEQKQWDNVIKEYQNIIDSKNSEIKALKEDLSEAEQANTKCKIDLEEFKIDMDSKEGAVVGLKKKIAELHVEIQVLLQGKIQLENEVKNVRSEMTTSQKSKDWYKDQLHLTQGSRNRLHQELITTQASHMTLSNSLEKAKSENNQLKQQLMETQQRAVKEKEVLMKHLETIEADMMERESLFEEIQKDKGTAEEVLAERARKIEEERSRLTNLTFMVSDLEHQLNVSKVDINEKEKLIGNIEKEKVELTKQVALFQKNVNDKDLSIQQLIQDVKDLKTKMKHAEMALMAAEELTSTLKDEKTAADVALTSANEEKRIINEALKIVKENLNRVESNFKHMRAELISKSLQAEHLLKEKSYLEETLQKMEDHMIHQRKEFEYQVISDNQSKDVMFDDLRKQKNQLENIISVYSKDLQNYQQSVLCLEKENKCLKAELSELKLSTKYAEDKIKALKSENNAIQEKFSTSSKARARSDLNSRKDRVLNECSSEKIELEKESTHYGEPQEMDSTMNTIKKEYKEKQRVYESNIKLLTRKLREKMKECKNVQNELKKIKESKDNSEKLNSEPSKEPDSLGINNDILEQKQKIADLEEQLKQTKAVLEEQKKLAENNQEIIIELEKEKGRITGIADNNNSLKLRITALDSQLGEKDSVISELNHRIKELECNQIEDGVKNKSKVLALEEELNKERIVIKGLRQQIFQEKRENSQIHRQLSSLKSGLEQANHTADSRKQEIASIQAELSVKLQAELKHRAEMEQLQTEIHTRQAEVEKMTKELEDMKARDPALAEQIKSLSWHLKEKNQEANALKEKLHLAEERHISEIEGLKKIIQNMQEEIGKIKNELLHTRKDKFSYQAKVAELRKALKSSVVHKRHIENQPVKEKTEKEARTKPLLEFNIPDPQASYDESYINSLLQQSLILPESRPLSNLQACLNSLKQEMAELQKQLGDQTEVSQ